ncbi:helix-hairpin-helix domain-containing protein [Variovorax sp. J31P207]|uniref:ComEA family DNA-binding protein n=1 Tax=Variovorax sp. J31P207 TaxID=3053510 RepID=UPI002575E62C|nr:helix-hairpin-helix domain-containing protein [Variovorax sp. J31P207]MDM0070340.1 helix-hairpin-helix domain-containing protein [Variovorax sp. J31P207]
MMKKIVAIAAMLFAVGSWAAVDANKATEAELLGIKGVGPAMSKRITDARKEAPFKDWADFMGRVKGVKDKAATQLSAEGLTIDGQGFGAPSAPAVAAAKVDPKAAGKAAAAPVPVKAATKP